MAEEAPKQQELTASSSEAVHLGIEVEPDTMFYRKDSNESARNRPTVADLLRNTESKRVTLKPAPTRRMAQGGGRQSRGRTIHRGGGRRDKTGVVRRCFHAMPLEHLWCDYVPSIVICCGASGPLARDSHHHLEQRSDRDNGSVIERYCNQRRGKGGAYFLISRSLGPLFGGVIGLLFFLAQAVATSMYVIGFADSIIDIYKKQDGPPFAGSYETDHRIISAITMVALLLTASCGGAAAYAKTQVLLLVCLVIAILGIFVGAFLPAVPDEDLNARRGFTGFDLVYEEGNFTIPSYAAVNSRYVESPLLPNFQVDPVTSISHSFMSVFSIFSLR